MTPPFLRMIIHVCVLRVFSCCCYLIPLLEGDGGCHFNTVNLFERDDELMRDVENSQLAFQCFFFCPPVAPTPW